MHCPKMRYPCLIALAAFLFISPEARARSPDLGAEFVLFADSTNALIPDVQPAAIHAGKTKNADDSGTTDQPIVG